MNEIVASSGVFNFRGAEKSSNSRVKVCLIDISKNYCRARILFAFDLIFRRCLMIMLLIFPSRVSNAIHYLGHTHKPNSETLPKRPVLAPLFLGLVFLCPLHRSAFRPKHFGLGALGYAGCVASHRWSRLLRCWTTGKDIEPVPRHLQKCY